MCAKLDISDTRSTIELCALGLRTYIRALEDGFLASGEETTCLRELGLVRPVDATTLAPVAPSTAARLAVNPLRRDFMNMRELISHLDTTFAAAETAHDAARRRTSPSLLLIQDPETISAVLQESVRSCRKELLTAQPGGRRPAELLERALAEELPALGRGVQQRTIYQHTVRSHPPTMEYIQKVTAAGAKVRTLDEVIDRLIVCDRHTAYIPTGSDRGREALEIRDPAIVRFLVGVFENAWSRARPLDGSPSPGTKPPVVINEIQLAIARMLVEGHAYSRIAHALGMSQRTVAAHVSRMSTELGSQSPAQLGYFIAVNHLLDRD